MSEYVKRWLLLTLAPYGMYLIGYVFESRIPGRDTPIYKDQALAFLLGEPGLALLIAMSGKTTGPTPKRKLLGLLLGVVAFIVIRRVTYKPEDYSREAWRSPTKLYHDVVICGVFGYLIVVRVVPFYFGTRFEHKPVRKVLGLAGLATWATTVVTDELGDSVPNGRQHPTTWKPIWRRA